LALEDKIISCKRIGGVAYYAQLTGLLVYTDKPNLKVSSVFMVS